MDVDGAGLQGVCLGLPVLTPASIQALVRQCPGVPRDAVFGEAGAWLQGDMQQVIPARQASHVAACSRGGHGGGGDNINSAGSATAHTAAATGSGGSRPGYVPGVVAAVLPCLCGSWWLWQTLQQGGQGGMTHTRQVPSMRATA